MIDAHPSGVINSAYIALENVPVASLDSVVSEYLSPTDRIFIKIDTQYFEW